MDVLDAFDIDSSFINDPVLMKLRKTKTKKYQNKRFFQTMDEAYLFIPMIKNIVAEYDAPQELLFLAMAESNFSTKAYSVKKASGLWQFMPYTGKVYGLKIDAYVDERRDLVKSTRAAMKFLTHLHKRFGKWYLAAIAYNCGGGRLSKAIRRAGTDDLKVLLDPRKKYLPRESRFYIRKIIALSLMATDESLMLNSEYEYLLNRANAYSISTVKLPRGEKLSRVAKLIGMPYKDLKKLNNHLKYDFMPPYAKSYDVYIPYIKLSEFKQNYKPLSLDSVYLVHIVTRGDNLSYLGKKYGVGYKIIKDFNNLKTNNLALKQKLIIPTVNKKQKRKFTYDKGFYTVKSGDTLDSISKKYRVSIKSLKRKNSLKSDMIRIGTRLSI
ncbi:MAG: transglycosylase SLT domain-containing protein [Helicobacteraceae bacterium]|nr:transglycosylase SLT domain-containing protein [Helicobacteraceae bacterium]